MTSEEWLEIVDWITGQGITLTVDVAARMGVVLRRYPAGEVRAAVGRLIEAGVSLTGPRIGREVRSRPSKYARVLEERHRSLYPGGCANPGCDVCLTRRQTVR